MRSMNIRVLWREETRWIHTFNVILLEELERIENKNSRWNIGNRMNTHILPVEGRTGWSFFPDGNASTFIRYARCERAKRTKYLLETRKKQYREGGGGRGEDVGESTSQSTERCARGRAWETRWKMVIRNRGKVWVTGFTGCHNPRHIGQAFSFLRRVIQCSARLAAHGKSANHEAILGRRKRRRGLSNRLSANLIKIGPR